MMYKCTLKLDVRQQHWIQYLLLRMVFSRGARAFDSQHWGHEFESRSLHLKPETKLLWGKGAFCCKKGLKTVPLALALLSQKPAPTKILIITNSHMRYNVLFVFVGLRLNNARASGTVLRLFLQPESPLSSRSLVSGFNCKLRDSNSWPPYSRPRALTIRLYTIHVIMYISKDCQY